MSCYTNSIPMLAVATYAAATSSQGFDLGEYVDGALIVHITGLSGTNPRIIPTWSLSYNATGPRSGRYVSLRSYATALKATGLSVLTLPATIMGKWAKVSFSMAGTGANVRVGAWAVLKGQS